METSLDRCGRIIIPKDVRDDMGLEAGVGLRLPSQRRVCSESVSSPADNPSAS